MANLEDIPPLTALKSKKDIQTTAKDLTTVLQKTIEERIQVSKLRPHSKHWWNSDLQSLKRS